MVDKQVTFAAGNAGSCSVARYSDSTCEHRKQVEWKGYGGSKRRVQCRNPDRAGLGTARTAARRTPFHVVGAGCRDQGLSNAAGMPTG